MDGYAPLNSGLFVPPDVLDRYHEALTRPNGRGETVIDLLRKAGDEQERIKSSKRGSFFSNYTGSRGWEGPFRSIRKPFDTPNFALLRALAQGSVIDRAIIDVRIAQVKSVSRRVYVPGKQKGWRVVHKRHEDPTFDTAADPVVNRCRQIEDVIDRPYHKVHKTTKDFLSVSVEEEMVLDRQCLVISRDSRGRPVRFHLVPGDTVLPILHVLLPWMEEHDVTSERLARHVLSEQLDVDLTDAAYLQEVDGQVVEAWKESEMDVEITNPTIELNHLLYGRSMLEKSVRITKTLVNLLNFNDDLFRPNFPSNLLLLFGDYDAEGLENFARQVLGEGDASHPGRLPVIPANESSKAELVRLRDTPTDMQFAELFRMMTALKCAAYRMHPSSVNMGDDRGNNGTVYVGEKTTSEIIDGAQEEGMHAMLDGKAQWLTRVIVEPIDRDYQMIWEGLEPENETARLANLQVRASWAKLNEIRQADNLPPVGDDEGGGAILNPVLVEILQAQQAAQQAQQQQSQYEGGDFGDQQGQPGQQAQQDPQQAQQERQIQQQQRVQEARQQGQQQGQAQAGAGGGRQSNGPPQGGTQPTQPAAPIAAGGFGAG